MVKLGDMREHGRIMGSLEEDVHHNIVLYAWGGTSPAPI